MSYSDAGNELSISPSVLGQYIQSGKCPRFGKLQQDSSVEQERRDWNEAFLNLNPVLRKSGNEFEEEVYDDIRGVTGEVFEDSYWESYDNQEQNDERLIQLIEEVSERSSGVTALFQTKLQGGIGEFDVKGDADVIMLVPKEGSVQISIFDVKASHDEKTYQQIQTVCYSILLEKVLESSERDIPEYSIETGIITRDSMVSWDDVSTYPSFERRSREADVYRLLSANGPVSSIYMNSLDDAGYQFDSKCHNCMYKETCYTNAVETADIRLLGLTQSEQYAFRENGLETLYDVAQLIEVPDSPSRYDLAELPIRSEFKSQTEAIAEDYGVSVSFQALAQQSQTLLTQIDPEFEYSFEGFYPPDIHASGGGNLPGDENYEYTDMTHANGSMVRVYLDVQSDYVTQELIQVSGSVTATNRDSEPYTFSVTAHENLPNREEYASKVTVSSEKELLEELISQLITCMLNVQSDMDESKTPVHFYMYEDIELTNLVDACNRYTENAMISRLSNILTNTEKIEESFVSTLESEIENHYGTHFNQNHIILYKGLFNVFDNEVEEFPGWEYEDPFYKTLDLSNFRYKLFNMYDGYQQTDEGILFQDTTQGSDGVYPIVPRFGSSIPLEYFYVCNEIGELTPDDAGDENEKRVISQCKMLTDKAPVEIQMLQELGIKFARLVQHIERAIQSKDILFYKDSYSPDSLFTEHSPSSDQLHTALKEYIRIEHQSEQHELARTLQKTPRDRVLSGESLAFTVESIESKNGSIKSLTGNILLSEMSFSNPDQILRSTKLTGNTETSSGEWCLTTELTTTDTGSYVEKDPKQPKKQLKNPKLIISDIDYDEHTVTLQPAFNRKGKTTELDRVFNTKTHDFVLPTDEDVEKPYTRVLEEGRSYILDPSSSSGITKQLYERLETANESPVYKSVNNIQTGSQGILSPPKFTDSRIREYLTQTNEVFQFSPNTNQQDFIMSTEKPISLLQGPPGTGKTSGGITHAALSRVHAFEKDTPFTGVITSASNKAINEVLESVVDATTTWNTSDSSISDSVSSLNIIRIGDEPENPIPGVEYVSKTNRDKLHPLYDAALGTQQTLTSQPTLLFATSYKLLRSMETYASDNSIDHKDLELFDMMIFDEASMVPLPKFFATAQYCAKDTQLLISGDQRQMNPVQRHMWKDEQRQSIARTGVYLSTLNYLRLLQGDTIQSLGNNHKVHTTPTVAADSISMTKLEQTYRCHTTVADFLQHWVYKQDDINYYSTNTTTLPDNQAHNTLGKYTQLLKPITLITHTDTTSKQSNILEASLIKDIVANIPQNKSIGVVTPHNAQKGLINATNLERDITVDTVERFQGGQEDVIILSTTVSDPTYIQKESEFLLDLNRLNVAISRMKQKLIILAPETIFKIIPDDTDLYENTLIWKGLYTDAKTTDTSPDILSTDILESYTPVVDNTLTVYNW